MKSGELKMSALHQGTYPRMSQVFTSQHVQLTAYDQTSRKMIINTCYKQGMGTKNV